MSDSDVYDADAYSDWEYESNEGMTTLRYEDWRKATGRDDPSEECYTTDYDDWRAEVACDDTLEGFTAWCETNGR